MDPWVLGIGHSSGRADNAEITLVAAEENLWRTVVDTPATAGIPEVLAFRGMLGAHIDRGEWLPISPVGPIRTQAPSIASLFEILSPKSGLTTMSPPIGAVSFNMPLFPQA